MPARGRPRIDNEEILNNILASQHHRLDLFARLRTIEAILGQVELYNDSLKDSIESAAEKMGLTKGFISKLARLKAKGKLADHIQEAEQFQALMELSAEASEEDTDEEVDEDTTDDSEHDEDPRFDRY